MSRCDSAAMVPKTREDFPEPETPVKTVKPALGNVERDIGEIVLPGAAYLDQVVTVRGGCFPVARPSPGLPVPMCAATPLLSLRCKEFGRGRYFMP